MHDERHDDAEPRSTSSADAYWRANKRLIAVLLAIWALVSFGFAILLARPLDGLTVGRLPMGFWWAQQGAMVVFVALIFIYARAMDHLDAKYDVDQERPRRHRRRGADEEGER